MCVIVDRWLCILTGIVGAVLASQLPGYTLQYMQNLRGRLDELEPIVQEFELDVMQYNYTLDEALVECQNATMGSLLDALCNSFDDVILRYEDLEAHYLMLEATGDYKRPFVLMGSARSDIARSVTDEFEPAVPANDQGFVYAGVGFLLLSGSITVLFATLRCLCCRTPTKRLKQHDAPFNEASPPEKKGHEDSQSVKKEPDNKKDVMMMKIPDEPCMISSFVYSKDIMDTKRNIVDTECGQSIAAMKELTDDLDNAENNDTTTIATRRKIQGVVIENDTNEGIIAALKQRVGW